MPLSAAARTTAAARSFACTVLALLIFDTMKLFDRAMPAGDGTAATWPPMLTSAVSSPAAAARRGDPLRTGVTAPLAAAADSAVAEAAVAASAASGAGNARPGWTRGVNIPRASIARRFLGSFSVRDAGLTGAVCALLTHRSVSSMISSPMSSCTARHGLLVCALLTHRSVSSMTSSPMSSCTVTVLRVDTDLRVVDPPVGLVDDLVANELLHSAGSGQGLLFCALLTYRSVSSMIFVAHELLHGAGRGQGLFFTHQSVSSMTSSPMCSCTAPAAVKVCFSPTGRS